VGLWLGVMVRRWDWAKWGRTVNAQSQ